MEYSNSDANHIVWHEQNDRCSLEPMETGISAVNHAVLHAQNDR